MIKRSIPKKVVELPVEPKVVVPEVKVEPSIEVVVQPSDMTPIADAIKQLMLSTPKQEMEDKDDDDEPKKPKQVKIEVERDGRGFIKSLMCTEIVNG